MDEPPHPGVGRAITFYLLAADLAASADESAHPRIAFRMQQSAEHARVQARRELEQVIGGGGG